MQQRRKVWQRCNRTYAHLQVLNTFGDWEIRKYDAMLTSTVAMKTGKSSRLEQVLPRAHARPPLANCQHLEWRAPGPDCQWSWGGMRA